MAHQIPPILPGPDAKRDPATELKSTAQVLFLYAFLLVLPPGMVIALSDGPQGAIGLAFFFMLALHIGLLVLAGVFLRQRKKAGVLLAWTLFPFMLLAFPIGTLAGVFVAGTLKKPEVRALIS